MKKPLRALLAFAVVIAPLGVIACSQHDPGPYEGGGRTEPTQEIGNAGSGPPTVDASGNDTFVPDTFIPDSFIPDVTGQ